MSIGPGREAMSTSRKVAGWTFLPLAGLTQTVTGFPESASANQRSALSFALSSDRSS
jgi:hypothetical protein